MIMNLLRPIPLKNGSLITEIQCYENGSFTFAVQIAENKHELLLFNSNKKKVYSLPEHLEETGEYHIGIALSDDYYLLFDRTTPKNCLGDLFDNNHSAKFSGITRARPFANGWYVLRIADENILYNDKHQKMASNFDRIEMFSFGYALHQRTLLSFDDWTFYFLDGTRAAWYPNVEDFIGDGNILINDTRPAEIELIDWNGHHLTNNSIVRYYALPCGRFVLTFSTEGMQMFDVDGTPISATVKNAEFLPDGRFFSTVSFEKRLYRSSGFADKTKVTSYENLGNLYILSTDSEQGILFDCNGERLGVGYKKHAICGRFALLEHNQSEVELFYNNRKLWSEVI